MAFRIGLIGLDTSHSTAFTELLNGDPKSQARVTCAFPAGQKNWNMSWSRIEGFTSKLREKGVAILQSPEDVAGNSDLVFITEVDGAMHRNLFERVATARKPVFVDKPFATTAADAQYMLQLAQQHRIPLMSCSSLRYAEALTRSLSDDSKGPIKGVDVFGPMALEEYAPGLLWYGVHGIDMVVRVMGAACEQIHATVCDDGEVYTMRWKDGRLATYRGLRNAHKSFGAVIHREKGFDFVDTTMSARPTYALMLDAILASLPNGHSDVPPEQMLEVVKLMVAGNQSRSSGQAINL